MCADTLTALGRIELELDPDTLITELPVGHMQFVEIAREVDKSGLRVLVFDEPTAVLAESEAEVLLHVMRGLANEGLAILFITHRLDEVMQVADKVTILRDGALALTAPRSEITIERIAETMVGRTIEERTGTDTTAPPQEAATILDIRDLRVAMPGERVSGADLDVRRERSSESAASPVRGRSASRTG